MNPENEEYNTFHQIVSAMEKNPKKQLTMIIGIDGCGGSGKSTLAAKLQEESSNVTVIHMDDFYLPTSQQPGKQSKSIGADLDWKRVLSQVLEPISQNLEGNYQRYDWNTDSLAEWHTVPVGGTVIIEGVYSTRRELADNYDLKIWVDCPREIRLARGLERDGEEARDTWENNWMISEDAYVQEHRPFETADLIVSGTK